MPSLSNFMSYLYLVPNWFYGYDISIEFILGLITLLVGFYALKVYKLIKERDIKYFGIGFLLISLAYFLWGFLNLFIISEIHEGTRELDLTNILVFSNISIYIYLILLVSGLAVLTFTTLKEKNCNSLWLLLSVSLVAIFFGTNTSMVAYGIASILLLFIFVFYLQEYRKNKNISTGIVMIAFFLIFIGTVELIFAQGNYIYYVLGHGFKLIAYVLILVILINIFKHGKEKKSIRSH